MERALVKIMRTSRKSAGSGQQAAGAPPERLSPAGERLLRIAKGASRDGLPALQGDDVPAQLSEFIQTYREWIALERGALGTQQQQADQWQMLMHCMVGGATIQDAIGLLLRFSPVVWGDRAPSELRDEGEAAALVFHEPHREGSEGLVAVVWMLALTLCELEFLANARFEGVSGRVIHQPCLPDGVARLLFAAPIAYGEKEAALLIPKRHLRRAVVARAADLPQFFRQLMPLTLGAKRGRPSMQTMVAGLIRDDKRGPVFHETSRGNVAARLGVSDTTLRRRLQEDGVAFRQIKEGIYNELAQAWLNAGDAPVEEIAARLDFSDSFAFRRFFRRLNGCAPSAFRQRAASA
jgi:AraC-like DNA-binding protein